MLKKYLIYAFLGTFMGYVLTRIGFANYDELHKMFVLEDLRMMIAFAGSVALAMIASLLIRLKYKNYPLQQKIFQPGTIPGSMLFGFGWAVSGACPSLVFVQLGEGKIPAVMTLVGIYVGVVLYKKIHSKYFMWDVGACSST